MTPHPLPDLIYSVIEGIRTRRSNRPALVAVSGPQGSGKSTVCWMLEAANRGRFAHFSLDDVYLTHAERQALARDVHPLCSTRGPPGTHDLKLADDLINALEDPSGKQRVALPRFDKARDDRAPEADWPIFSGLPYAILIDGWCLGAKPLDANTLATPLNALEREEGPDGVWRRYTADRLADDYQTFFEGFDATIYLQAPSWDIVRRWRGQQEEQMLGRTLTAAENAKLDRFVMHYERVTRAMLAGHHCAEWIVHLDDERKVQRIEERD